MARHVGETARRLAENLAENAARPGSRPAECLQRVLEEAALRIVRRARGACLVAFAFTMASSSSRALIITRSSDAKTRLRSPAREAARAQNLQST
ncbi:MAG: hypothetical protein ACXWVK_03520, partial [Rhodoplanes sp.]